MLRADEMLGARFLLGSPGESSASTVTVPLWRCLLGCAGAEATRIMGANPESIDGIVNGNISLACDVRSHPTADITWYKDGRVLRLGEEGTVTPGTLGGARMTACPQGLAQLPALDGGL